MAPRNFRSRLSLLPPRRLQPAIARAAATAQRTFPGWIAAGFHHGYLFDRHSTADVVRQINDARPDVLLVGMGNPLQETWIHQHRQELEVPLCIGVGGLFSYWAGNLRRAPCRLAAAEPNGSESFANSLARPAATSWAIRCSSGEFSATAASGPAFT